MPAMLSNADDACPHSTVCQASPNSGVETTPNANSDLDSDNSTSINSAWAGIAVVIVVIVVGLGVWYGIRRRRRTRGGHNSVAAGGRFRLPFGRGFGAFWRRSSAAKSSEQPIAVGGDLELVEGEEAKQRRSSSVGNLKRMTTSETLGTDAAHAAKLDSQSERAHEEARVHPMASQSAGMMTPAPSQSLPSYDASRTTRPSTPSSIRSSLSRLSIPPPGLGPPIHAPAEPPSLSTPPSHTPSNHP